MALTTVFHKGVVTAPERAAHNHGTPDFGVYGVDDFKVSAHPSIPFAVLVRKGRAHRYKVTSIAEIDQTVPCPTLAGPDSNIRWDLVVVRDDWSAGTSVLAAISVGSSPVIPETLANNPGVLVEQPLALVKWQGGTSAPVQIIDLRCHAGNGGIIATHILALDYLARPGADVLIGNTTYRYAPGANGVWGWVDRTGNGPWVDLILGSTAGVPGVRTSGAWVRVGGAPNQARLVAGGTLIQVRGEASYSNPGTPSYTPAEGWAVASLPASMAVSEACYIVGTSDRYSKSQVYVLNPNRQITLGPGFTGLVAQFNGIAPV